MFPYLPLAGLIATLLGSWWVPATSSAVQYYTFGLIIQYLLVAAYDIQALLPELRSEKLTSDLLRAIGMIQFSLLIAGLGIGSVPEVWYYTYGRWLVTFQLTLGATISGFSFLAKRWFPEQVRRFAEPPIVRK